MEDGMVFHFAHDETLIKLVLMLVDPPIKVQKPDELPIQPMSYQGGYTDFTPWATALSEILHLKPGPPRTSALNDLAYYIKQTFANCDEPPTTEMPALILRRLALSHYMLTVEVVKSIMSYLENEFKGQVGGNFETLVWLEKHMEELVGWDRSISEFCNFIEAAMEDLEIPSKHGQPMSIDSINTSTADPCKRDFSFIHGRLLNLKLRIENLISVVQNTVSNIQAVEATNQTRTTTLLTIIALIFAPMALIASVFSMGGRFAVGEVHFWVYWAFAVPTATILTVYLGFWMMWSKSRVGKKYSSNAGMAGFNRV